MTIDRSPPFPQAESDRLRAEYADHPELNTLLRVAHLPWTFRMGLANQASNKHLLDLLERRLHPDVEVPALLELIARLGGEAGRDWSAWRVGFGRGVFRGAGATQREQLLDATAQALGAIFELRGVQPIQPSVPVLLPGALCIHKYGGRYRVLGRRLARSTYTKNQIVRDHHYGQIYVTDPTTKGEPTVVYLTAPAAAEDHRGIHTFERPAHMFDDGRFQPEARHG